MRCIELVRDRKCENFSVVSQDPIANAIRAWCFRRVEVFFNFFNTESVSAKLVLRFGYSWISSRRKTFDVFSGL